MQGHWTGCTGPGLAGTTSEKKIGTKLDHLGAFFLSASLAFGEGGCHEESWMCSWLLPGAWGAVSWPSGKGRGQGLPWQGSDLAVLLTAVIKPSVPLCVGLLRPLQVKHRKLLGPSLSAVPCLSRAYHMPASSAAQPALSVQVPRLPLPPARAPLTTQTSVLHHRQPHRGLLHTCGPAASAYPVVTLIILIFQFITSPLPWDVIFFTTFVATVLVFHLVLILSQAAGLRLLHGTQMLSPGPTCSLNLTITSGLPPSPLCVAHVCLPCSPSPGLPTAPVICHLPPHLTNTLLTWNQGPQSRGCRSLGHVISLRPR